MNAGLVTLACAGGAALAGVAAELVARAWLARRGRPYVWSPFSRLKLELDRDALPMLDPVARWEVNADGERGAPLPADWSRTLRVLVTGGSAAECYFVDQPKTWPEVLGRALSRPENLHALGVDRVHVGNVARSLVACEEIELMLARTLPRYGRVDVAVLMVGASDLVHWLEKGTPDHIPDVHVPPSQVFALHPYGPFGWGPRTLALRRIASYWRRRLKPREELRTRVGKRLGDARAMRARAKELVPATPDPEPMLAHYEAYLRRVIEHLRAKGARVIVARQAWLDGNLSERERALLWNFGRGRPYAQEVTTYYAHELVWKLLRRVDERTRDVAQAMGVEQFEINPLVPKDFEHFYDELHFTPKGCEIVGEAVAKVIVGDAKSAGVARRA